MNMTLKKVGYLLSALLAITLVITWTMNIQVSSRSVKYNTNPDLSSKFVASENFIGNKIPINTLEELTNLGDVIIRGTVISDNKEVIVSLSDGTTANLEQKFNSKYPDKTFGYNTTQATVNVDKVLFSNVEGLKNGDSITFSQMGNYETDEMQTKVKKDKKYVFFLKFDAERNVYASVAFEEGLFEIDDNNKSRSLSKNKELSKYDGIDLSVLEDDIAKAINKR